MTTTEAITKTTREPKTTTEPPLDDFQLLQRADALIRSGGLGEGAVPDAALGEAFKTRGKLLTKFGVARLGISDLEKALAKQPDNAELVALLGEANRVYARDVLFGGGVKTRDEVIEFVAKECIPRFHKALAEMEDSSMAWQSWLHAHLAACHTLIVSMAPSRTQQAFELAKNHFEQARRLRPDHAWNVQYEAFLYAVRGQPGDFDTARRLLHDIRSRVPHLQSSIDRSLSMLYSYDTDPKSLADSVSFGLEAASRDSEDPFALYFAGASMLRLATADESPKDRLSVDAAMATLESARIRATNAISQATALLAAIASLQGQEQVTTDYLASFGKAPRSLEAAPDLETLSMLSRDHTWDKYRDREDFKRLMQVGVAPRTKVWWTV